MLMASDSLPGFGQTKVPIARESVALMHIAKSDARWPEAILLTVALWLFVLLIFMPGIIQRHGNDIGAIALDSSTIPVSMLLAMPLFALFRATLAWKLGSRIAVLLGGAALAAIVQISYDLLFQGWLAHNIAADWSNVLPRDFARAYESTFRYLLVFTVNIALFQLSFARRREFVQDRQLVDARSSAQQAQLMALRYQLNPHFLFNALNSISALIVTRRNEDAERMTDKLSSFLRNSLSADPTQLVPLEDELSLIEEYLDIEGVRFGERLDVSIACQPDAGAALVPGFLVQPLVENAIKHGVAPSRDPIHIQIDAKIEGADLCITVENDTAPKTNEIKFGGSGVGLINVERRLQAVYGKRASLSAERVDDRYVARICIPGIQRTS